MRFNDRKDTVVTPRFNDIKQYTESSESDPSEYFGHPPQKLKADLDKSYSSPRIQTL
jgi:hypothetical protein